ncbi:MAG TPA: serine hydrolase domain-containing protein, partial [Herpetosiphonaceae bacterium]|nr:serine hydrolase domain-containing protein [Herpetosiphonaceae bacterium]
MAAIPTTQPASASPLKQFIIRHPLVAYFTLAILVLPVVHFMVRPLAAASRTSAPDVARIDAFVRDQVQRHGIPGLALALVEGDRIIHLAGYGKADQSGRPVTPQTPFIVASISKSLTALAVMQLVEAGKVELDAPVQRYLPAFRVADPVSSRQITVRQLLLHTSGIPLTACDTRENAETLEQFVAELQTVQLDAPVGARHNYCSGNYNVLGRIVEVVSGQSFGDYIEQQVFAPLQMRHSFTTEEEAQRDGLVQNYQWVFGLRVPTFYRYNPSQLPSGYLISSAEDMAHFLIAQLNEGGYDGASVLSPDGIAAMQARGVSRGEGRGEYGLGLVNERIGEVPVVGHDGAHFDARTFMFMQPETRRGAVLLLNAAGIPVVEATAYKELREGVSRLLAGQEPAPAGSLSVPVLYFIVDAVLACLFALALWPLLRL